MKEPAPWHWRLGATLALGMAAGTFMLFALSVLAPFLVNDLGLTRTALGALPAVLFTVGGLGSLVSGLLIDVFGGRKLLVTLFVLAGAGWVTTAAARGVAGLLVGVAASGVALAVGFPAITKLVSVHVPRGRRGVVMGVAQSGSPAAQLVAGGVLPTGALLFGWRGALMACALALPLAVLMTFLVVPAGGAAGLRAASRRGEAPTSPVVRWMAGYAFLINSGVTATTIYLPLYAHERLDLSVTLAGAVVVFTGLLSVPGKLLWGEVVEHAAAPQRPLLLLALLTAVGVGFLWSASLWWTGLLWIGVAAFGLNGINWPVALMLTVARQTHVDESARVAGKVMMWGYLGAALGPVMFGYLTDAAGSYTSGWGAVAGAFLASAALARSWHRATADGRRRSRGEP